MPKSKSARSTRPLRQVVGLEVLEARLALSVSPGTLPLGISPKDWSDPLISSVATEQRLPPLTTAQVLNLQSKPGSNFTIYLDFDGQLTTGTDWNTSYGMDPIISPPFDLDGNTTSFNQTELERILISWQRTAEDYAPFDVNVTTRDPGTAALINSGGGDAQWGARAIVTVDNFAACGCGGFAYLNSFGDSVGTPTFVFNLGEGSLGETFSHEVGHMLGLNHDGLNAGAQEYYRGHGTGALGWGAIMGAPFDQNITQWDRGEYFDTSNTFDNDLQVITTQNGFTYRADDVGNTRPLSANLNVLGTTTVNAFGIIETGTDLDYFRFETGTGTVSFDLSPLASRPNVDLWAGLYSSAGALVAQSNPGAIQSASLLNIPVSAGTYYLRVEGIGSHDTYQAGTDTLVPPAAPAPWTISPPAGYSNYGSLGQYKVSGTIPAPGSDLFTIVATDAVKLEGNSGQQAFTFTVTRSGNTASAATVQYA
ncbi:MAG TPA: zinc-dependent metalloprotease family protein, partial [Pirellulaceae bacterium]